MHGPQQSSLSEQRQVADSKRADSSKVPRAALSMIRMALLNRMTVSI